MPAQQALELVATAHLEIWARLLAWGRKELLLGSKLRRAGRKELLRGHGQAALLALRRVREALACAAPSSQERLRRMGPAMAVALLHCLPLQTG